MPRHPQTPKRAVGLAACVVGWVLVATTAAAQVPEWVPGPPPETPAGPPGGSQEGSFDALSYNVAGLTEGISGSEPATNSALISPLLNAYDLVLLQEDWEDHFDQQGLERPDPVPASFYHHEIVSEVDHRYRSEPGHHPYGTDLRRTPPTGPPLIADGLNRLSRLPFDGVERVMWRTCHGELTVTVVEEILKAAGLHEALEPFGVTGDEGLVDGGSADCGAQKGFSFARTELAPGVEVDVYNLHGDAGGHVNDVAARRTTSRSSPTSSTSAPPDGPSSSAETRTSRSTGTTPSGRRTGRSGPTSRRTPASSTSARRSTAGPTTP